MSAEESTAVPDSAQSTIEPTTNGSATPSQCVKNVEAVESVNSMSSVEGVRTPHEVIEEVDTTSEGIVSSQPEPSSEVQVINCNSTNEEPTKIRETLDADSANHETPMEADDNQNSEVARSDREDSPELVIDTQADEEAPKNQSVDHHVKGGGDSSEVEIDLNSRLEESSDEEPDRTRQLKYKNAPQTNGRSHPPPSESLNSEPKQSVSPGYRAKQVAKLKQFFTTLQGFGNQLGSEAAEQVQELITALVNKTASIEEFHQEIQTVTNHPLKQFIIPFLQDNLDHLRMELKESSKTLSDILNQDTEGPSQNSFTLTPQPADDELPVYKTPQSTTTLKSVGVVNSQKLHSPLTAAPSSQKATRSITTHTSHASHTTHGSHTSHTTHTSQVVLGGVLVTAPSQQGKVYGAGTTPVSRTNVPRVLSHSSTVSGTRMSPVVTEDQNGGPIRHPTGKKRDLAPDRGLLSQEKDTQTLTGNKYTAHLPKRPRTDTSTYPDDVILTSRHGGGHLPLYPQPPLTYPIPSTTPTGSEGLLPRAPSTLTEDWKHLDMMLTSMQGMMERTRQAVALLKERITVTQAELERRELDQEAIIGVRVTEAVDKVKQRAEEEKQAMITETRKQIRDAVTSVRTEMETRIASTSTTAVAEALKEANKQSSSKENCWNCGRKATETCSGCNKARYCGTFCQHKDWSNHMHHCSSGLQVQQNSSEAVFDRRRTGSNDVAIISGRGKPLSRGMTVPVNLMGGGEMSLRHVAPRSLAHTHSDIPAVAVKTEKA